MSTATQDVPGELDTDLPDSSTPPGKKRRDKRPDGSKKRTKTGCMTCRRRRIKCDETKPICNNCRKSRRECDGYGAASSFRNPYQTSADGHPFAPRPEAGFRPHAPREHSLNTAVPFAPVPAASYQPAILGPDPSISGPTARTQHGSFSHPTQPSLPQLQTRHASLPQAKHVPERPPSDDLSDLDSYYDPGNSLAHQTGPIRISPILEQKHKHILDHFRVRLRPCISIYDKADNFNPTGGPGTTWGSELPIAAVSTPALAHAMIALSLQHMSTFGAADSRFARKHFWLSLKRSSELVMNKPFDVSTLATVLLLSWFNVMTGDHAEWDMHLRGASRLMAQHDFAETNRKVRRARFKARENLRQVWAVQSTELSYHDYVRISDIPQGLLNDKDWEVNDQIVRELSGLDMTYLTETAHQDGSGHERDLTDHAVSEIKVKFDLYWWYCKMDIFHGLLTGDPLLMPFETWNRCSPRGPMGDSDNISATLDHLLLIMGRLTDFGGRDRARKLKTAAQTGGKWVPVPGFFGPNMPPSAASSGPSSNSSPRSANNESTEHSLPPSANEGRARRRQSGQPTVEGTGSPIFYGMIPPPSAPPQMHSLFTNMNAQLHEHTTQPTSSVRDGPIDDLTKATHLALANHKSIQDALEAWRLKLPADFQPIPDMISVPESEPFGTALRYSHPLIACVWGMYHLALILLRRYHPFSPPAAMMSSGINAPFTRDSAQMIGKILAGSLMDLYQAARAQQILPIHYAALQELTFPVMFAGVQYQDSAQRNWIIDRLLFIASETGWRSSYAVASACQKTWEAMGKQGKGPPYERTVDRRAGPMASASTQRSPLSPDGPIDAPHDLEARLIGHDRDKLDHQPSSRAYFATGLLAVEADMAKLAVGN